VIELTENVLFLTSRTGTALDDLILAATSISNSGNHVRVLLIGDAVTFAVKGSQTAETSLSVSASIEFLACKEDLESRGLDRRIEQNVRALDYDEITDVLMTSDDKVVSYF
jgi:sulfur relay protein TusB/DsrH